MSNLTSFQRSSRHGIRSIICLSLCGALPMPMPTGGPSVHAEREALGGPGWYDSSWDLLRGLDIAEVPDLEAELALWIEACLELAPATELV